MNRPAVQGIDVSSHQGMVDLEKAQQAGYSFVIIKAGQGQTQMSTFQERYLPAAEAAGLDWGAYWWSDAVTIGEAQAEAKAFLKAVEGLKPTYPLWMDQEYGSPHQRCTRQQRTDMVKAFLDTLQEGGYYAGLYCSYDWIQNWLYPEQLTAYDKWIAQYSSQCDYQGEYGIWQHGVMGTVGTKGKDYTILGRVPGVEVNCDVNCCYKDYPAIIRAAGLNGWGEQPLKPPAPEPDYKALYLAAQSKLDRVKDILKE